MTEAQKDRFIKLLLQEIDWWDAEQSAPGGFNRADFMPGEEWEELDVLKEQHTREQAAKADIV
jgi:hypothetical protein